MRTRRRVAAATVALLSGVAALAALEAPTSAKSDRPCDVHSANNGHSYARGQECAPPTTPPSPPPPPPPGEDPV